MQPLTGSAAGFPGSHKARRQVPDSFLPGAGMTDVLVGSGSQPGPATG